MEINFSQRILQARLYLLRIDSLLIWWGKEVISAFNLEIIKGSLLCYFSRFECDADGFYGGNTSPNKGFGEVSCQRRPSHCERNY